MTEPDRLRPDSEDEDKSRLLLVVIWVEASLGATVMIVRLLTKFLISHNPG